MGIKKAVKAVFFMGMICLIGLALAGCLSMQQPPAGTDDGTGGDNTSAPTHTPGTEPDQEMLNYEEEFFKIKYPEKWTIASEEVHNVNVVFKAPGKVDTQDELIPTVNVLVGDSQEASKNSGNKDFDLDKYVKDVIDNLKVKYQEFEIESEDSYNNNNVNGKALVYKAVLNGYNIRCRQIIGENDGKIFVVTYVSDQLSYENFLETANKIINSFEINK